VAAPPPPAPDKHTGKNNEDTQVEDEDTYMKEEEEGEEEEEEAPEDAYEAGIAPPPGLKLLVYEALSY
jgi:hypothetical protein